MPVSCKALSPLRDAAGAASLHRMPPRKPISLPVEQARRLWLHAQQLDRRDPFGVGPEAARAAIEHLGYVQIDTINVIERCHHPVSYTHLTLPTNREV